MFVRPGKPLGLSIKKPIMVKSYCKSNELLLLSYLKPSSQRSQLATMWPSADTITPCHRVWTSWNSPWTVAVWCQYRRARCQWGECFPCYGKTTCGDHCRDYRCKYGIVIDVQQSCTRVTDLVTWVIHSLCNLSDSSLGHFESLCYSNCENSDTSHDSLQLWCVVRTTLGANNLSFDYIYNVLI